MRGGLGGLDLTESRIDTARTHTCGHQVLLILQSSYTVLCFDWTFRNSLVSMAQDIVSNLKHVTRSQWSFVIGRGRRQVIMVDSKHRGNADSWRDVLSRTLEMWKCPFNSVKECRGRASAEHQQTFFKGLPGNAVCVRAEQSLGAA